MGAGGASAPASVDPLLSGAGIEGSSLGFRCHLGGFVAVVERLEDWKRERARKRDRFLEGIAAIARERFMAETKENKER